MHELKNYSQFKFCVSDLIDTSAVQSMDNFIQHSFVTTLEHCVFVAYVSYTLCKFLGLNYYAAARGGLLHDLFLYDRHDQEHRGKFHGFTHSKKALENANVYFELSKMEKDIIKKHMWPLTLILPRYAESFIVCFADKFCASIEVLGLYKIIWFRRIMLLHLSKKFQEITA
ncbi:MAG: HDIG domain-containing protein [Oscillospiraceae bacterium]